MGLREKMNENPKVALGVAIGVVVFALAMIVFSLWPSKPEMVVPVLTKCFYTEDDGKTYFPGDRLLPTPIKGPNGKDAVIAHVFIDTYGKQSVIFLEKYTDEGNKILKSGKQDRRIETEKMVKRPGSRNWVNILSEEGQKIARPPDFSMAEVKAK